MLHNCSSQFLMLQRFRKSSTHILYVCCDAATTKCSRITLLLNSQRSFWEGVITHQSTWKETSTGQRNQSLRGQEYNQPISEHSEEDDLFPIASLQRQSKSSSSASFLKVLGVGSVHRNASNASWLVQNSPYLVICIGESQEESCALIWYLRRLAYNSFFLSICRLTTSYKF